MEKSQRSAGRFLRGRLSTAVITVLALLTFALAANAQVPTGFIVMFQPGTAEAARADSAQRAGAVMRFNYSIVDAIAVTALDVNAFAILQQDRSVIAIIPDWPIYGDGAQLPSIGPAATGSTQTTPAGVKRVGVPRPGSNGNGIGGGISADIRLGKGLGLLGSFGLLHFSGAGSGDVRRGAIALPTSV